MIYIADHRSCNNKERPWPEVATFGMTYCINFICLQFNRGEGSRNRENSEGEDSCKT